MNSIPTLLPSTNERVPAATVPFRCDMKMQVRFSDIDILGHANNNAIFAMLDLAKIDYFERITGDKSLSKVRAAVVNINCDFYEPIYFADNLHIFTTICRVGRRSFTLEQRAVDLDTQATKCRCLTVLAGFDPATATPIEVDADLIAAASAYEQRDLLNPTL